MKTKLQLLFLFCNDTSKDPLAPQLLAKAKEFYSPDPCGIRINSQPVFTKMVGNSELVFIESSDVASYQYHEITEDITRDFPDASLISVVNWHAGTNAPSKIFCAHTTADVTNGIFGPATSSGLSAVLRALEAQRIKHGLIDWKVLPEASHWSGTMVERAPQELLNIAAPVIDLELGSYPEDWNIEAAQWALVHSFEAISTYWNETSPSILYFGGIHFEPNTAQILFHPEMPCAVGHILPNQWIVSGQYGEVGAEEKVIAAIKSHQEAVSAIVFQDNVKGPHKEMLRRAAADLQIPCMSHKKIRDIEVLKELYIQHDARFQV